ncbi:YbdD/YjiX family protein [Kribbella catacumbae]|uniref:YbdD/YjiX family protein n=1 Tax=Kribbella catacumbae TaxID=460086 RepID=UPI0003A57725|nr:YbdD/YjiX family protein [Kribbella catacumbae]
MTVTSTAVRAWRGIRWYLREATGESAYDRYVAKGCTEHPGSVPMDRRTFERHRQDLENQRPQQRCC